MEQDEDVGISESVQSGLCSSTYAHPATAITPAPLHFCSRVPVYGVIVLLLSVLTPHVVCRYDVGRYAPAVEQAAHAFHLLLHTHLNSVA
jgi:hypothetical protein